MVADVGQVGPDDRARPVTNLGNPIKRGTALATPLNYGSGHVQAKSSFDPGLVYDNDLTDWVRYGCGINQFQLVFSASVCASFGSIDPSELNYPSIAVAGLAGTQTVTRTFTNTSPDKASQYKATIETPAGTKVTVNDGKITVPPLQSRTFKLTITRTDAPLNQWTFGAITWTDKRGHAVRSPIAVKPVAAAVPSSTNGSGASGSQALTIRPGYTGQLNTSVTGLAAATVDVAATTKPVNSQVTVVIPAGSTIARFATYDADYAAGTDIDLSVSRGGTVVGTSGGGSSEEAVTLSGNVAGTYVVTIDYFAGATDSLDVELNSFAVGSTAVGNLTATPASQAVTTGVPATVTLAWTGLDPTKRYLGAVGYSDGTTSLGRTLVNILP